MTHTQLRARAKGADATLAGISDLLATKAIPALDVPQMSALLHHMFYIAPSHLRIQVAEVVFRFERDHPQALGLFLACAVPLAERAARRRAQKFLYASAWQVEAMYDGAVASAIALFERATVLARPDSFRRYLLCALAHGTLRCFVRAENTAVHGVATIERVRPFDRLRQGLGRRWMALNTVEEQMITRELLHQVIGFKEMPGPLRATLGCIAALGPDCALKAHTYTASGDPDRWKRERGRRPILDPDAIAAVMGVSRKTVHAYLCQARIILRAAFNGDGRLFMRR